jgi:hypothetical protein
MRHGKARDFKALRRMLFLYPNFSERTVVAAGVLGKKSGVTPP